LRAWPASMAWAADLVCEHGADLGGVGLAELEGLERDSEKAPLHLHELHI
jgi:hypothetical protein